jgi:hypothetical protein
MRLSVSCSPKTSSTGFRKVPAMSRGPCHANLTFRKSFLQQLKLRKITRMTCKKRHRDPSWQGNLCSRKKMITGVQWPVLTGVHRIQSFYWHRSVNAKTGTWMNPMVSSRFTPWLCIQGQSWPWIASMKSQRPFTTLMTQTSLLAQLNQATYWSGTSVLRKTPSEVLIAETSASRFKNLV